MLDSDESLMIIFISVLVKFADAAEEPGDAERAARRELARRLLLTEPLVKDGFGASCWSGPLALSPSVLDERRWS